MKRGLLGVGKQLNSTLFLCTSKALPVISFVISEYCHEILNLIIPRSS